MTEITEQKGYTHKFLWQFLLPKYWSIWLGVLVLLILAFVPYLLRDKLAVFVGKVACRYLKKKGNKQFRRSDINLRYCFPDWNEDKRLKTIEEMFITVAQTMLGICKNGVNLSGLSTFIKLKRKAKILFCLCHTLGQLMHRGLFCIHTECRWFQCIIHTEMH